MEHHEQKIVVHSRITRRHPDVTKQDVQTAWIRQVKRQVREGLHPTQIAAVGFDDKGRLLQMVATYDPNIDTVLIFHAMRATKSLLKELGLRG